MGSILNKCIPFKKSESLDNDLSLIDSYDGSYYDNNLIKKPLINFDFNND